MRESIYFPVMISSPIYAPSFFESLANAILKFKTPEGVSIQMIYNASDQLTEHIFEMVRRKNYIAEYDNPEIIDEKVSMIEIVFNTEESLIHKPLPWLEEQILDYVRGYEYFSVVLYLFYLVENGTRFRSINIAKVFKENEVEVDESPIEDDMSYLYGLSGFLNALWNRPCGELFDEKFPDLTAKFFLYFGG